MGSVEFVQHSAAKQHSFEVVIKRVKAYEFVRMQGAKSLTTIVLTIGQWFAKEY
jgi:hypothetical protein